MHNVVSKRWLGQWNNCIYISLFFPLHLSFGGCFRIAPSPILAKLKYFYARDISRFLAQGLEFQTDAFLIFFWLFRQIVHAEGPSGPNREYLFQLEKALMVLGRILYLWHPMLVFKSFWVFPYLSSALTAHIISLFSLSKREELLWIFSSLSFPSYDTFWA